MNKRFLLSVSLVVLFLVTVFVLFGTYGRDTKNSYSKICEELGGLWLSQFNECEYAEKTSCIEVGGKYSECESACRHDDEVEMCTLQCVPVCSLGIGVYRNILFSIDPLNASYRIENEVIPLVNGEAEKEIVPGSASKLTVKVFGEPVRGDLNGDFIDDALVLLVVQSGGSGTFYYAATAVGDEKGYQGTNAVFLGDRIVPQTLEIKNGVAIANYADRAKNESMAVRPSIGVSKYMTLRDRLLVEIPSLSQGEQVLFGYLTYGHEMRTFRPCGEGQSEYWLSGDSPSLSLIKKTYEKEVNDVSPSSYAPLFAVVVGTIVDAPKDGFGADYERAISVSGLIRAERTESCKSDSIVVFSPLAGAKVTSPLVVKGFARGTWYFEADFPVLLVDWDGRIIAEGIVTAKEDWMTESFVPFTATVEFTEPQSIGRFSDRGALILKKDNPSDLPQYDDALEIPIYFK